MTKKNQICNNWYAHVKSDLRSLPTYAHRRRPTLYFLCLKRARKPRTANSNCIRCAVQMQLRKFTTEVKKWSIFLTCWFLSLILFYMVLGGDDNRDKLQGRSQTFQNGGGACKGGSWGWLGLKMAALHRPLYKVSFHLGGLEGGGAWFLTEGAQALLPTSLTSWMHN